MKRISMLMVTVSVILMAAGCGKAQGDREAARDIQKLSRDAAADINHAVNDAEYDAAHLSRAISATTVGVETEVRQAGLQVRSDLRAQPEVNQARLDAELSHPVDPAQLRQEVKRDAVDAAGAAAEEGVEKLFKSK